jgi:hypothetical protein
MKPANIDTVNFVSGSNSDIQKVLESNFSLAVEQVRQNNFFLQFKGSTPEETAKNVWEYLKENIEYKADGYHQKIVLPARLKVGDCKSLSLFACAILYCFYPNNVYLRYVSYNNSKTPTHVYCVLRFSLISPPKNEIIIDAVWHYFNQEKKYTFKKDIKMKISTLSGITGIEPSLRPEFRKEIKKLIEIRQSLPKGDSRIDSLTNKIRAMKDALVGIEGKKKGGKKGGAKGGAKGGVKKVVLAPSRNAYLLLVKLNVRGLASRLKKAIDKDKSKIKAKWEKLGGNFTKLEKEINRGANKKALFGSKKMKGIDEYLSEDNTIGAVDWAAIGTALATAAPIIATLGTIMKAQGVSDSNDNDLINEAGAEGGDTNPLPDNVEASDKEKTGFALSPMLIIGGLGVIGIAYFVMKK